MRRLRNLFWPGNLYLFDRLTLGVLAAIPPLYLFAAVSVSRRLVLFAAHGALILAVLAMIHREARLPAAMRWLRTWYPLVLFTMFFSEIGRLTSVFLPFWLESHLLALDRALFGQHAWQYLAPHLNPFATEVFAFAYWSYYPLIPGVVWLHFRRRHEVAGGVPPFDRVITRLCVVMYFCYACFLLMPARGPHHVLHVAIAELTSGGPFFDSVLFIQKHGSVVGSAFPSSHVAAAWTMVLTLRRRHATMFVLLLPLVLVLSLSTFVLQYHYVIDAVAGVALALILELVMERREKVAVLPHRYRLQPARQASLSQ